MFAIEQTNVAFCIKTGFKFRAKKTPAIDTGPFIHGFPKTRRVIRFIATNQDMMNTLV